MKRIGNLLFAAPLIITGCAAPNGPQPEKGPQGTVAYNIPVESNPSGAKVEVNYKLAGVTPLTIKIFGDRDGTFHNFGSDEFIIRAYPPNGGTFPQTKIFKTGAFGVKDDKVPERIAFDFTTDTEKP